MDEQREKQLRAEIEARLAKELAMRAEEEAKTFDWDYDQKSQTLTISGQGHMPSDWHPWGTVAVSNIIIKDGVKSISPCAFINTYGGVLRIDFGNTLQTIGEKAFMWQTMKNIYVFPNSLKSVGKDAFNRAMGTFCFKSQYPPLIDESSFNFQMNIEIPTGCLKQYVSSSKEWQSLARIIKEKDVSLMYSSLELEAIEAENKRKEEELRKKEEEEYMARVEAELRKKMGL